MPVFEVYIIQRVGIVLVVLSQSLYLPVVLIVTPERVREEKHVPFVTGRPEASMASGARCLLGDR
jgi:hypothetical protein